MAAHLHGTGPCCPNLWGIYIQGDPYRSASDGHGYAGGWQPTRRLASPPMDVRVAATARLHRHQLHPAPRGQRCHHYSYCYICIINNALFVINM
jgi:hypothetical protein